MADDPNDRLTILERAQLLHDATLRRHGELLAAQAERLDRLDVVIEQQQHLQVALRGIAERLTMQHGAHEALLRDLAQRQASHDELLRQVLQTLDAIKERLERRNGRP